MKTETIFKLLDRDPRYFIEMYYEIMREGLTSQKAYEKIENILIAHTGKSRYSDYESFVQVKNRIIRTEKK
jgi:hypothetical protein